MGKKPKCLWELLWDYDPNGLVAVDETMAVQIVNPAFCRMFRTSRERVLGTDVSELLGDVSDLAEAWDRNTVIRTEQEYPDYGLYVRKVMFAIREEGIAACILVDMTQDWHQRSEMLKLQRETIKKVHEVVDNQMKVAQEIAGLLGETTAETKVSLLRLVDMVEREQNRGG